MAIFAKDFMARGGAPGGGDTPAPSTAWTRPADWLELTEPAAGEQKFVGLHAVWPTDGNFVAFTFAGAYTVDWGDGSALENVASGTTAYHEYTYSSISSSTDSTRGYRQVIVTVTPQSGANLTSMNLFVKHNQSGLVNGYSTGWLDIAARLPNLTSLTIGSSGTSIRHNMLEQVKLLENGTVTNFSNLFYNLWNVRSVQLEDTSGVTNTTAMFRECYSLDTVSLFDTSAVTNMSNMFENCYSLQSLPLFDTSSVTNMYRTFYSCYSLESVPLFNTSSVTTFQQTFYLCYSLSDVPLIDMSSATNLNSAFQSCLALKTVPLFDTSAATNMSTMFAVCKSLTTIPLFNTSAVTTMLAMFNGCTSLESVPLLDTSSVTNTTQMFQECFNLSTLPAIDTSSVTSMSQMFRNCHTLSNLPALDASSATSSSSYGGMFDNCNSLASNGFTGHKFTFSVQNNKMSAAALDTLYTNLATVVGQTITVTGNYGTAADDPTIATNKGWTVTG
jgi:surface protein